MHTPTLTTYDPWDSSPLAEFPIATPQDVTEAVLQAHRALRDWSRDPALRRQVISKLGEVLKSRRTELATLISRETGKVLWESLLEVDAMANKCALSLRAEEERRTPTSKSTPAPPAGLLATTYRPHGVALVLGPFNFPGHLPLGHIAPALLAGNTVLFKPSEKAPAVADLLLSCFHQAGLPPNVLQVLHGGPDVATALIDADINAVLFTGSYAVGTKILSRLTHRPGVLTALEMGGNNPLIAWDLKEESIPAAVLTILQSAFATAGQRCSCTRRLIIPTHPESDLLNALVTAAASLHIGHPLHDPNAFYGTLIDPHAAQRVLTAQAALVTDHYALMLSCQLSHLSPALLSPGIAEGDNLARMDDEIFGPLLQVHHANTFDEALHLANATHYGLVSGLLTDNPALWDHFRLEARAGVLTLNRPTTGASSELPFGGIGHSGNHRPSAYFAADYCSYPVAEMSSPTLSLPDKLPPGIRL